MSEKFVEASTKTNLELNELYDFVKNRPSNAERLL